MFKDDCDIAPFLYKLIVKGVNGYLILYYSVMRVLTRYKYKHSTVTSTEANTRNSAWKSYGKG